MDKKQQPAMECGDDDTFLRESRAEIEAARRLLDCHSISTSTATAISTATATAPRANGPVRITALTPATVAEKEFSPVAKQPAIGTIRDPGGEAAARRRVTTPPTLGALPNTDRGLEPEDASSNSNRGPRSRPSDRSGGSTASGRADGGGELYRAALSTHLSFIATTAADDPPPSLVLPDGRTIDDGQRKSVGGVGEACRALQGDVAGVRQVRQHKDTCWG